MLLPRPELGVVAALLAEQVACEPAVPNGVDGLPYPRANHFAIAERALPVVGDAGLTGR